MHYTTFVWAGATPRVPLVAIGPQTLAEVSGLPLVTSLHRIGNEVMALVHASPWGVPMPVSDVWIEAVAGFGGAAKVALLLAPVPAHIATSYAPIARGVPGADLPPWTGALMAGRLYAAIREVPVSAGAGVGEMMMAVGRAPVSVEQWADQVVGGP